MNSHALRPFHRRAAGVLLPVVVLAACASDPYPSESRAPAPDLAGTHWTVTLIDGRDTLPGSGLTTDFGVDGRVNGDSGCNSFSGSFVQTGSTVRFGELLSTRRACVEDNRQRQEERMLDILSGGTTVRLVQDELRLRGASGTMTFVRAAHVDADTGAMRRVQYDCQGVPLTVEYGGKIARLSWPDGNDVLRLQTTGSARITRYESRYSDLRIERDVLWGRQGGMPRSCIERR